FSDQISVGHGVCVQLAEVVKQMNRGHVGAHASHDHAEHTLHLMHESMDLMDSQVHHGHEHAHKTNDNHKKQLVNQDHLTPPSTAPPSTAPPSTNTIDHHAIDTAQCGFCLLLGHSVLPPVPEAQLQAVAFFDLAQAVFSNNTNQAISSLRGLIPQSRAPPIFL
ncbi:MAG: hypothetical protein VXW65_09180, partial [Pseudomonadota bacterium]|nr:hypothetical protein [Pseudomonadota bacterium]